MPTAAASRTIAASPQAVWEIVGDPRRLALWWPRVQRVEGAAPAAFGEDGGGFTQVLAGRRGRSVRADFSLVEVAPPSRIAWSQELAGTPFEAVLRSAVTRVRLAPARDDDGGSGGGAATEVRIELAQELQTRRPGAGRGLLSSWIGGVPSFGAPLVKRAAARTLAQALDGLARALGEHGGERV